MRRYIIGSHIANISRWQYIKILFVNLAEIFIYLAGKYTLATQSISSLMKAS